ncbi:hypothetical protein [Sorangium sp. So ce1153]|uniref:hypothetical protein n=1 Tax=Sorangium sp. So ce1153 TaxID=3133333 RepID=UPI003F638DE6
MTTPLRPHAPATCAPKWKIGGLVVAGHCKKSRVWTKLACRDRSARSEKAGDGARPPALEEEAFP